MNNTYKRFYLWAVMLIALTASSSAENIFYQSDFSAFTPDSPLAGWHCQGANLTAKDGYLGTTRLNTRELFPVGSAAYQVLSIDGTPYAAYSNSDTEEGSEVDEWLISPPINVAPGQPCMLEFSSIAIGSVRKADFDIYVSTKGDSKKDFMGESPIFSGKQQGGSSLPKSTVNRVVIPAMGEEVYLAFVNRNANKGLLGFHDISLQDYCMTVVNNTPSFLQTPGMVQVNLTISAQTPVPCNSLEVTVDFSDGRQLSTTLSVDLYGTYHTVTANIGNPIEVNYGESLTYTVTVRPVYENAKPSVTSYGLCCEEGYPSTCVMEEGTGLWCTNCIRGMAAIERYSEVYGDRFIGLAVHIEDLMEVPSYAEPLQTQAQGYSVPFGWFNRSRRNDPIQMEEVDAILRENVPHKICIDKVEYDTTGDNDRITISYSPEICYSTDNADFSVVAVIAENGCSSPAWIQSNGYSGKTPAECFGEEWWPYFKEYSNAPRQIAGMSFNHVAWGIFNDYFGEESILSKSWTARVAQNYTLSFDVPICRIENGAGVRDPKNTFVVVMLIDRKSGEVLNADMMSAAEYYWDGDASVKSTDELSHPTVLTADGKLIVRANPDATIEIFNMKGECNGKYRMTESNFELNLTDGIWMIRVTDGNNSFLKKIIV